MCTNKWPLTLTHTPGSHDCRRAPCVAHSASSIILYRAEKRTKKKKNNEKSLKRENLPSVPLQININPGMFSLSHLFKRSVDCFLFLPLKPPPCAAKKKKERNVIGGIPPVIPGNDSQRHQSGLVCGAFSSRRIFAFRTETLQMSASRFYADASPFISRLSSHPSVCFLETWLYMNLIPGFIRPSAKPLFSRHLSSYAKVTGGFFLFLFTPRPPSLRLISLIARQSA